MRNFILAVLLLMLLWILVTTDITWSLDLYEPLAGQKESSGFGFRRDVMGGAVDTFHGGVDLTAPEGTIVQAAAAGRVARVWYPPGWRNGVYYKGHDIFGGLVEIVHVDGSLGRYGHQSKIFVHEGQWVEVGDPLGVIGNTGISTGTHLHFEIRVAPVFLPQPPPSDLFWRRLMIGFVMAEQAREATP